MQATAEVWSLNPVCSLHTWFKFTGTNPALKLRTTSEQIAQPAHLLAAHLVMSAFLLCIWNVQMSAIDQPITVLFLFA